MWDQTSWRVTPRRRPPSGADFCTPASKEVSLAESDGRLWVTPASLAFEKLGYGDSDTRKRRRRHRCQPVIGDQGGQTGIGRCFQQSSWALWGESRGGQYNTSKVMRFGPAG